MVACAVATGTDYTILTIARLRGGTGLGGDRRTLAHHAVAQLGPAIGVAGLLLAGLPCRSGGGRRL
ncbi:MMPL family transporter [Plantactinospora sp. KLBMP9567]|uniref:MMPL family transporter n=1 Tax=Plantactinospora sp. KLBMP9567 TaxID=3085900 RepID=UPI0039903EAB